MERNIDIIRDADGNKIVMINDIRFKGKRKIDWEDVEAYLRKYIGDFYEIAESGDMVYIGSDEEVERYNVFRVEMLIRHADTPC